MIQIGLFCILCYDVVILRFGHSLGSATTVYMAVNLFEKRGISVGGIILQVLIVVCFVTIELFHVYLSCCIELENDFSKGSIPNN